MYFGSVLAIEFSNCAKINKQKTTILLFVLDKQYTQHYSAQRDYSFSNNEPNMNVHRNTQFHTTYSPLIIIIQMKIYFKPYMYVYIKREK